MPVDTEDAKVAFTSMDPADTNSYKKQKRGCLCVYYLSLSLK